MASQYPPATQIMFKLTGQMGGSASLVLPTQ